MLVGNEEDLQKSLGIQGPEMAATSKLDPSAFLGMIDRVVHRYPRIKIVATTLRDVHSTNRHQWGAVAWINGQSYLSPMCDLDVHDRVGGGDGFASGLFYGLLTGESAEEAVRLGWAHGALITTFPGDTTMATLEQVEAFARGGSARIQTIERTGLMGLTTGELTGETAAETCLFAAAARASQRAALSLPRRIRRRLDRVGLRRRAGRSATRRSPRSIATTSRRSPRRGPTTRVRPARSRRSRRRGRCADGYTPSHKLFALNAATGARLWMFDPGVASAGPNRGVMYWRGGGETRVFAAAADFIWALDAKTGQPIRRSAERPDQSPREPGPRARDPERPSDDPRRRLSRSDDCRRTRQ